MRAARRRFMMPLPLLLCLTAAHHRAAAKDAAVAHVTVSATAAHGVDHRIFGVMAERADWDGEGGIEAAWTPARASSEPKGLAFRANLVNLWDRLGATVVRFPGGGLADRYDWRWGIDHVPGRPGPRPLTAREDTPDAVRFLPADTALRPGIETHFVGTDEAARLCERTGAQLSLTVNVLWFKDDYARGAKLAADWVEYCNAPNDGRNPNGGVDWARVRALNGHPRPYNVRLWEIGNETWLLPNFPMEPYGKQVAAYANAMRAVDPRIEIIADGQNPVLQDSVAKYAGRRVQYIAFHHYEPWAVDLTGLTPEQTWNAAASLPTQPWEDWLARMTDYVRRTHMGYKVALTEWNTHGWSQHGDWTPRAWPPALPKYVPFSLGLAAWLNDLIRHADLIPIADASLLAGREWSNSLIRYGWDENKPAFGFLGYWVLRLYAHHTGDRWLPTRISGGKTFSNPLPFGESRPRASVPYLDVAATRNARTLFLNVVNRSANDEQPVVFHLASFGLPNGATGAATMMRPATTMADPSFDAPNAGGLKTFPVRVVNGALKFAAPSHSVCIIALPLGRATVGKKIVRG